MEDQTASNAEKQTTLSISDLFIDNVDIFVAALYNNHNLISTTYSLSYWSMSVTTNATYTFYI